MKLWVGAKSYGITLTAGTNNLAGLRDAINSLGVGATATVLTTGTGATPNYLSLSANSSGAAALQLFEDPDGANTNLVTSANQGANAIFKLNGVSVSKTSNLVNDVVSGATFTILGTTDPAATVSLTLATDRTQLQSAIQAFASKYNALVDSVGGQVGPAAGLLSGDLIVREVQNDLRQVASYQGSGDIKSLSDLGVQLGKDGKITFDTTVFTALSASQVNSAFDFFGSPSTGFGGLSDKFSQITDPVTGLVKLQQDNYADRPVTDQGCRPIAGRRCASGAAHLAAVGTYGDTAVSELHELRQGGGLARSCRTWSGRSRNWKPPRRLWPGFRWMV